MDEHFCRACILLCMDFRLHEHLDAFMTRHGLGADRADVIRVAGAVKSLARPDDPRDRERLLEMFTVSYELHHAREFHLVNHEDCGAYGLEKIADDEREIETHRGDLRRAREVLAERFPDVEVHCHFAWLDGDIECVD